MAVAVAAAAQASTVEEVEAVVVFLEEEVKAGATLLGVGVVAVVAVVAVRAVVGKASTCKGSNSPWVSPGYLTRAYLDILHSFICISLNSVRRSPLLH